MLEFMKAEEKQSSELMIVIDGYDIEKEKKENALQAYQPFMQELDDISCMADKIDFDNPTSIDSDIARKLRLKLVPVRTGAEKKKKERKETILLLGKLEDHATGVVVTACKLMESRLEEVEKHAERKEKERLDCIRQDRMEKLEPFEVDIRYLPLGIMSDEDFKKLLSDSELLFNARIEAEKKKEEQRLAAQKEEANRLEEQRLENERLKKEAEKREIEIDKERKKAKVEQDKKDAIIKLEREKADTLLEYQRKLAEKEKAKQKAELQTQRQEAAKKEALLKAENDKLIAEKKKHEDEDERKILEAKEADRKASLGSDKEKLIKVIDQLDSLVFPHDVKSYNAKRAVNDTISMVEKLKAFIIKRSEEL